MGRSAVLIEPGRHLERDDIRQRRAHLRYGQHRRHRGIGDEFLLAIGAKYGGGRRYTFEPHVAEEVFNEWIAASGVPVYFESPIAAAEMDGATIKAIETANGHRVEAKVFIDTTYEGDLMALAGVSYTVGREPNAQYGETLNGVRGSTPSHQFTIGVDPYVVPGDPGSGLLPYIMAGDGGAPGSGDAGVQAYNFRLCLTRDPVSQIVIGAPDGYDAFTSCSADTSGAGGQRRRYCGRFEDRRHAERQD
ncbi:MAG: FAD-dependent oxidoreductase [Verrucomicrobiales bacterium]